MKDYQNDKFENFFLNLKISREGLAAFGDFTAMAVAAPGVEALIAGHGADLKTAVAGLRDDMVTRRGQGGSSQTSTSAEQTAYDAFKLFLAATDKKVLAPYLFDHADDHDTYYPDNLGGLTQALVKQRLTRLTAYTQALETSPDETVRAQGAPARALLKKYEKASTTKTTARTALQQTIGDLGPSAVAVVEALWDVHTAACYVHRREPMRARQYFDFASLPSRAGATKKAAAKTA
ncbi:hypothetical protein [Hymenobacter terricola]|uniref:hypothetical protein n=1 Tax=Hymenobacter terricola TaxID=2819236 RepID=UPI001B3101D0|nr:hypothetical protein [Hymenobacter terricola]